MVKHVKCCLHGEARPRQTHTRSCTVHYVRLLTLSLGLDLTGAQFNCVQHGALSELTHVL